MTIIYTPGASLSNTIASYITYGHISVAMFESQREAPGGSWHVVFAEMQWHSPRSSVSSVPRPTSC